jgi:glycosyltransferase involved in cell wall biosynthesis
MRRQSLRVAMIIQAYLPCLGGAERQLAALIPLLRRQGVEITIITRRYAGLSAFETIDGVSVYRLPIPGPKAVASLSFTLAALPLLRRLRPDVIHAHELLSPTTTAVVAKQWLRIPIVAKVLRGGVLGDLAKLEQKPLGQRRMRSFKRLVDGFIVISQEIDEELANWEVPVEKRFFIPNGVDTRRFVPVTVAEKMQLRRQLGLEGGKTAVYTGRLVAEKRVDALIALWPQVRESVADAQLLLLGTGPEAARLRQQAGAGIHFLGQVQDVAPYLQTADLFVLPSATEGLSNAMLEGLAVGLPVIATDVGGAPDVITDQKNGWLIPAQTHFRRELLAAILTLFTQPDLRQEMGLAGRQKVMAEYGLKATADKLMNLYGRMVNPSPQGAALVEPQRATRRL